MSESAPPTPPPPPRRRRRPTTFLIEPPPHSPPPRPDPPLGRPHGTRVSVFGAHGALRHHHFAFVRFVVEGVDLREAWARCLAFAGGVDDRRHFARRLREICAQIRVGAEARKRAGVADTALQGLERHWLRQAHETPDNSGGAAVAPQLVPVIPQLDDWIDEQCSAQGIDVDFQTQADWLQEYLTAFGLDAQSHASGEGAAGSTTPAWQASATAHAEAAGDAHHSVPTVADTAAASLTWTALPKQLEALRELTTLLVVPPVFTDRIEAWLAPSICEQLRVVGILTLADLANYADLHGHRWHRHVHGLGAVRSTRLIEWLAPLVDQLGRPLRDSVLKPAHHVALARQRELARLDPLRQARFGLVPLERLAVPPELSGRHGTFRMPGLNTLGADDDLTAIRKWLQRYERSPRTYRSYFHAAEVFYLWCVSVRRQPLSSLVEADLHVFRAFLAKPPPDWVQSRNTERASSAWRPLRGALDPQSQRHLFAALGSLYTALHETGYVSAQPMGGVKRHLKLPRARIDTRRSFTEQQWACVLATLASLPNNAATRRTRLVLELGATTGMRLAEICTARLGNLRHELVEGKPTWILRFIGKGGREREAVIFDDVKAMLDAHQLDMVAAGIGFDPAAPLRALTPQDDEPSDKLTTETAEMLEAGQPVEPGAADPSLRPLVGALRRPVPRWRLDHRGVATLDRKPHQSDAYGALEPSALYQTLKRLFGRAAERGKHHEPPLDATVFCKASTHWLRHFFANNAVEDGVAHAVLSKSMGHADLSVTSIYVNPERKALVAEISKMRRRGN